MEVDETPAPSARPAGLPCRECEQASRTQLLVSIGIGVALGAGAFWAISKYGH
jgi:hypothetical protein